MDQNQDNIDSDLQKAIDDITNTEAGGESVFDDPLAAPTPVAEGGNEVADASFEETPFEPMPELGVPPMPVVGDAMTPMPSFPAETAEPVAAESHGENDIRSDALRSLIPLLDKMGNLDAKKKFELCKMAFEDFGDPTMLEQALKAAKEIADESARGEALLYIVEAR